jgi:hypothetical protein
LGDKLNKKFIFIIICIIFLLSINSANATDNQTNSSYSSNSSQNIYGNESNQIIIRFQDTAYNNPTKMNNIINNVSSEANTQIQILDESKVIKGLKLLGISDSSLLDEVINLFKSNPNVYYAAPNHKILPSDLPNDPYFSDLWQMDNYGQEDVDGIIGTVDADIDAPEAWNIITGSGAVIIAVIDTGVDYSHPDLANNIWTNPGEIPNDGIDNDGNGLIDDIYGWDFFSNDNNPMDEDGHGTHVAGIIGAVGNNSLGITGVMWNVKIIPLRFIGPDGGYTDEAIQATG